MIHHRAGDPPAVKVTREIPLYWLITIVVAGIFQAGVQYTQNSKLQDLVVTQVEKIDRLDIKLQQLAVEVGQKNLKDVEHDLKIADHERRISVVEGGKR